MKTVSAVIKSLLRDEPYYGIFACGLNKIFSTKIKTAGVCLNGINYELHINKDWWYKLPPNERVGVIEHELLHLVFYHVVDIKDYLKLCPDMDTLNIAMDLEVQSYIDKKYRSKESLAEKIFEEDKNLERKKGTKYYIDYLLKNKKSINFDCNYDFGHGDWDDGNDDNNGSKKGLISAQLDYQLKSTAEQVMKQHGSLPGNIPEKLKEKLNALLNPKPPIFDWKAYFRRLLKTSYDIYSKRTKRKESNRFEDAFGLKLKKKTDLLVAIDTSGSICKADFEDFFSEIHNIWKNGANITILECDCEVGSIYKYDGKIPDQISGRGGTDFNPAVNYYNDNLDSYSGFVYFTDGFADLESLKPKRRMIWVLTQDHNNSSKYPGIVIKIPKK